MDIKTNLLCLKSHSLTTAELYPYIAYINCDGTPKDILFNSLVLDYSQTECRITQWENAIYTLFRNGENLRALDAAAGDIKGYLGLSNDYRWDVYIAAPVPVKSREYFGDINGNGIAEKLLTDSDCGRACSWFADNITRRFKACGFANINLAGWFFAEENQNLADVITLKGYNCIFAKNCNLTTESGDKAILASAISQTQPQRKLYNDLYNAIQQLASTPMPIAETVLDTPKFSAPFTEDVFKAAEEPKTEAEAEIVTEPEIATEEIKTEPKAEVRETVTLRKECITDPADNLKSIVLDIDISTGSPCPPPCQMAPPAPSEPTKKCDDYKKKLAIGTGIAAALLGIAYIFKKSK